MTTRRFAVSLALFLPLALALFPARVHAQSAIAGVVKDTSGAVLPGVSVEASSDVLIEKSRTVTTDGSGQFKIVDLRPGVSHERVPARDRAAPRDARVDRRRVAV